MGFAIDTDDTTTITEQDLQRMEQGQLLPDGWYRARVEDVAEIQSKEKGTEGLEFTWEITEPGPHRGEKIKDTLWDTSDTKRRRHFWECRLGVRIKDAEGKYVLNPKVTDWRDAIGTEARIELETEEFKRKNGTLGKKSRVKMFGLKRLDEPLPTATAAAPTAPARPPVAIPDDL